MMLKTYHIMVFRDHQGSCHNLRVRGWVFLLLALLVVGLVAGNIVLWKSYRSYSRASQALGISEKTVREQKTQLLGLSQKIVSLQGNLARIQDFDSRLRVMMNMDQPPSETTSPQGGPSGMDFTEDYLPLHRQELLARKMHDFLNQLNLDARLEEVRQHEVMQALQTNKVMLSTTPSVWPTSGWVTSPFGWRTSKFTGRREFHRGLDISAPAGTPVYAPAGGQVLFAATDGSYGLSVKIVHNQSLITRYAHLQTLDVQQGQHVERGQRLGSVGTTGRSTGPHLHYEVRLSGVPVDPMHYILN